MRTDFDPYEGCGDVHGSSGSAPGTVRPLWVAQAVQLIVAIAYAYDTMKNNSADLDRLLNEISTQLQAIRQQLDEVERKIDIVMDMISDLPKIIRGELEEHEVRVILGEAEQTIAVIADRTNPVYLDQNLAVIDRLVIDLQIRLGGITGTRGVASIVSIAPYLPAWLAGAVAVQKGNKRRDPNWNIQSPWQQSFMRQADAMFRELFLQVEAQDREFENNVIPNFPPKNTPLVLRNGILRVPAPLELYLTAFRVKCLGDRNEILQYGFADLLGKGFDWHDIDLNGTSYPDAIAAWNKVLVTRAEVIAFYEILPMVFDARAKVEASFVEPAGFWDVNA